MPPPMIGDWTIEVRAVRPFTIHGDLYYEVQVIEPDAPEKVMTVRIPQHALTNPPQPGRPLTLSFLMGQVTGAK